MKPRAELASCYPRATTPRICFPRTYNGATPFEEKGEPKRGTELASSAYQANAVPLGQTGSPLSFSASLLPLLRELVAQNERTRSRKPGYKARWSVVTTWLKCCFTSTETVGLLGRPPRTSTVVQELCESRGGRTGLSVLTSLLVSVDVKIY